MQDKDQEGADNLSASQVRLGFQVWEALVALFKRKFRKQTFNPKYPDEYVLTNTENVYRM